jgi:hypothetical protein
MTELTISLTALTVLVVVCAISGYAIYEIVKLSKTIKETLNDIENMLIENKYKNVKMDDSEYPF